MRLSASSTLPFALPMAAFVILTALEGQFGRGLYPALYAAKVVLALGVLLRSAPAWRGLLRWETKAILLGILAGAIGLPLWLGLDAVTPHASFLGTREALDPATLGAWRVPFLAVRFFGLALLVPLIEEIFWRGFLLRRLSDPEKWAKLSVERFTPAAALIVSGVFALAHPEWLAALVYSLGLCGLLRATKSLAACVTAHAVTNLLLGIYVSLTGNWRLW